MTQHTAEFLDITAFLADQVGPERGLDRLGEETWLVRRTPLDFATPNHSEQDWTLVRSGDLVRIPLLPYRTAGTDLSQLIMGAMDLQRRYDENTINVVRTHLIVGTPVEDLRPETETFRFWIGFAVRIR